MNKLTRVNGLFQFDLDSSNHTVTLHEMIPKQTLVLESVRAELTDAAAAISAGYLTVPLSFLVSSAVVNDRSHTRIIVPLQQNAVTIWTPKIRVDMKEDLASPFNVVVYERDENISTGLVSLQMTFSYDYASMG